MKFLFIILALMQLVASLEASVDYYTKDSRVSISALRNEDARFRELGYSAYSVFARLNLQSLYLLSRWSKQQVSDLYDEQDIMGLAGAKINEILSVAAGVSLNQKRFNLNQIENDSYAPAFYLNYNYLFLKGYLLSNGIARNEAGLTAMSKLLLPLEFSFKLNYRRHSETYYSLEVDFYLKRGLGLQLGFEQERSQMFSGGWIYFNKHTYTNINIYFPSSKNQSLAIKIGLSFQFYSQARALKRVQKRYSSQEFLIPTKRITKHSSKKKNKKKKFYIVKRSQRPSFSLLIKWGLRPSDAVAFRKHGNICTLSKHARKKLALKKWKCFSQKKRRMALREQKLH